MKSRSVAAAIREARKRKGWSQADLAKHSGVAATTIGGWEDGTTTPQLGTLAPVLDVLDLRLDVVPYHADTERPHVRVDPAQRFGYPNVGGVSVDAIGFMVLNEGADVAAAEYGIARAEVLVACWFLGWYGTRRWRRLWKAWADAVHGDMWSGRTTDYDSIPNPPDRPDEPATQPPNGAPAA